MSELLNESLIPLAILAREVPNRRGRRGIDAATLWRWTAKPNKFGLKLESACVNGTRMSSREALTRYIVACTRAANGEVAQAPPSKRRQQQIEAAERELASAK